MQSIRTLFNIWNTEYFEGKLSNVALEFYNRRSNTQGMYRVRFSMRSIRLNVRNRDEKNIQHTLLHEMVHAYLHACNRPHGHTPLFKSMLITLTKKAFGFVPQSNVRFTVAVHNAALALAPATPAPIPAPVQTIAPAPVPVVPASTRFKVKSNGNIGTLLGFANIYGKKHIRLQIPGMLFPFTCPVENVIPAL
jgi:predicted SprT family Zn-dependent metalloprotease